jgi:hypothetical protein
MQEESLLRDKIRLYREERQNERSADGEDTSSPSVS